MKTYDDMIKSFKKYDYIIYILLILIGALLMYLVQHGMFR